MCTWWGGRVPSGKGFLLAPLSQLFSRERSQALAPAAQSGPWGARLRLKGSSRGWGDGGIWEQGAQAPGSVCCPRPPQLACGMLWLSGYGPIWSQNATDLISSVLTLLEQLGPSVSTLQGAPG